jgi:hypothetical protein
VRQNRRAEMVCEHVPMSSKALSGIVLEGWAGLHPFPIQNRRDLKMGQAPPWQPAVVQASLPGRWIATVGFSQLALERRDSPLQVWDAHQRVLP